MSLTFIYLDKIALQAKCKSVSPFLLMTTWSAPYFKSISMQSWLSWTTESCNKNWVDINNCAIKTPQEKLNRFLTLVTGDNLPEVD